MKHWSDWEPFPNPTAGGYLIAPFGPGVYELKNRKIDKMVLFGMGKNVAYRMSSLLPAPLGCGIRNNQEKREYVLVNLTDILYRTKACSTRQEAVAEEAVLRQGRDEYIFPD